MQIIPVIYRIAIAFWVGGVTIFTFVLTPIIFKSYDRDTAGKIVGVLFPAYFRWNLGMWHGRAGNPPGVCAAGTSRRPSQ